MTTPRTKNYQQWNKFVEINWKCNEVPSFWETSVQDPKWTACNTCTQYWSDTITLFHMTIATTAQSETLSTLQRMCKYEENVGRHRRRPSVDRSGNPRWESCRHVSYWRSETRQTVTGIRARNAPVQQQTDWPQSIKSSKNSSISWLTALSFVAASATDHIFISFCIVYLPAAVT